MGTNYYAEPERCPAPCAHCRPERIHVGKSLCMFAAHAETHWGEIRSWADWKLVLRKPGVRIVDEYDREHDAERFIADVERVPMPQRRRQFDAVQEHNRRYGFRPDTRDYLDADGFSFYEGEFS